MPTNFKMAYNDCKPESLFRNIDMAISPEQIKKLRKRIDRTQREAAADVHVSLRTWQSWETPDKSQNSRQMPEAHLELFCLKNKISYPPRF